MGKRDRIKMISAISVAVVLLALALGGVPRLYKLVEGKGAQTELPELQRQDDRLLIQSGESTWQYQDSQDPPAKDANELDWTLPGYDATAWKEAQGSFGSVNGERTDRVNDRNPANLLNHFIKDGTASIPVYYFRTEIMVDEVLKGWRLNGTVQFDDSVVTYLNGTELYSSNTPKAGFAATGGYGAMETVDRSLTKQFTTGELSSLRRGKNVIAVEVHQANGRSSDVFFDFQNLMYQPASSQQGLGNTANIILQPGETERSMQVSWVTTEKSAYSVQYALKSEMSMNRHNSVPMEQKSDDENGLYCYTTTLNNLEPNTGYAYRIVSSQDMKASKQFYFDTQTLEGDFSFIFGGDPQLGANNMKSDLAGWDLSLSVAESINPNAAFILSAGDQIDSGGGSDAMKEYFAFRTPQTLKRIPIATVRGNHESGDDLYDLQFKRLNQNSIHDSYFTYNGVLFVTLNTNNNTYSEHRKYLEHAIAITKPRWTVVAMHYSIFSSGPHAAEDNIVAARKSYSKLFSDMNVDLVLSGHDHLYARSYLMKGSESTGKDGGEKLPGETQYLAGSSFSGSKYYDEGSADYPYLAMSSKEQEIYVSSIQISDDQLKIETYRVMDLEKVDTCVIKK